MSEIQLPTCCVCGGTAADEASIAISTIKQWPTGEPYISVVSHGNRWASKRVCHSCCVILGYEADRIRALWKLSEETSS